MVIKKLLRFYFSAGGLNALMDNAMSGLAVKSAEGERGCGYYAERIIKLYDDKTALSGLWARLNGIIAGLTERDVCALKKYASLRCGTASLTDGEKRELHRVTVKFSRHAKGRLTGLAEAYRTLCAYYALIPPQPDG